MKTTLLMLAFAAMALSAYAGDSIPNGNFELWTSTTYETPLNYPNTSNNEIFAKMGTFNVVKTADAYHGQWAVQLSTLSYNTESKIAYFLNCDPKNGNISLWTNGMPYSQKPTGIRGYYKYNVATADSGLVIAVFRKNSGTIGTYMTRVGGVKNTYTLFNATFSPALTQTPDSVIFGAVASDFYKNNNGVAGSVLKIDSVSFTGVAGQPALLSGDFEQWQQNQTTQILTGWNNDNKGISKTTDAKTGQSAVELITYQGTENNVARAQPGYLTNGYYDNVCNCTKGGKPFTNQVDTLAFWYKYTPVSTDKAQVGLSFKKAGNEFWWEQKQLSASVNYQYVEMPFNVGQHPDSLIVQIQSSLWENKSLAFLGSDLKIDNMYFKSKLHTGIIIPTEDSELRILPNNSTGKYWIKNFNSGIYGFEIYNATGINIQPLSGALNEINITNYPNGIYFVKIHTIEKTLIRKILKF